MRENQDPDIHNLAHPPAWSALTVLPLIAWQTLSHGVGDRILPFTDGRLSMADTFKPAVDIVRRTRSLAGRLLHLS